MCEFQPPNRTRAAHLIDTRKNMDWLSRLLPFSFSLSSSLVPVRSLFRSFVIFAVQMQNRTWSATENHAPLDAKWNVNENRFSICLFCRKQIFRFTSIGTQVGATAIFSNQFQFFTFLSLSLRLLLFLSLSLSVSLSHTLALQLAFRSFCWISVCAWFRFLVSLK